MNEAQRIVPVILSGGSGSRLWPISQPSRPKQLHALTCERTMLQLTALRAADSRWFDAPVVVSSEQHAGQIQEQLTHVGIAPSRVILEPVARNTAPAISLAALSSDEQAVLLVMPCDHIIADVEAFRAAIEKALPWADKGWLVTFGIKPTHAETGYGYIRQGEALDSGVLQVSQFAEKPDQPTAQFYVAEGNFLWNAGIFMFKAGAFLQALGENEPEVLAQTENAMAAPGRDGFFVQPDKQSFARCPAISVDHAVMEKAEKVAVVPVEMGWSDVGSWDALHELSPKDGFGNSLAGTIILAGSTGCSVRSTGPVVAGVGLEDLIVVATPDAVLIVPRGRSQEIKALTDQLAKAGYRDFHR